MRVGLIGLGSMGSPMAANLIRAGISLVVHNRTREKEEPLASMGAERAASPAEAAAGADVVVIIVSDTPDVEQVLFGQGGVASGAKPGLVVCDMSTIDPSAAIDFARKLEEQDVGFVDAPVSGGTEGAAAGTLSIMAGGNPEDIGKLAPVFDALGKPIHIGPVGSGQMTKAINQTIIAGTFLAVAEGMAMGVRLGLDMDQVLDALSRGAADSWVLKARAPKMLRRDYPLGFKLSLHRKDLRIALDAAGAHGLHLPIASAVAKIEDGLIASGFGNSDMSSLFESVIDLNES